MSIDVHLGQERVSISYPEKTYHNKEVQSVEHTIRTLLITLVNSHCKRRPI